MNKAKAELKNLRIAPRKVRRVSDVLRGALVNEAFAQLQMMTWRAAPPVYKLLKSAVANAKNKNMDLNKLFIESIMVNQGPMLKRHLPRA
ncbi:MAG: 50S ribosomal protein L22 [Candidatus Colwellbacteria bacterium]|nr:50S ribosomal protein L22 [Candidatus Colwellbacteria bacterium]